MRTAALLGWSLSHAGATCGLRCVSCLLKNALVASFNLAKRRAKLRAARKTVTYVAILSSHPCEVAAFLYIQQAATLL